MVIEPKFPVFAANRLIYQEKASFLHIVTKSVEPIFQGLEPIVRHRALKGTLLLVLYNWAWKNILRFYVNSQYPQSIIVVIVSIQIKMIVLYTYVFNWTTLDLNM